MLEIGSKVQVWNGKAKMTAGGLKKKDIVKVTNKRTGVTRYKSKEQQANGKKTQKKSQKARAAWTRATKTMSCSSLATTMATTGRSPSS